ncbi:MAG: bifunctional DNA-formamidopyrimidine glycosylase/DNA-(apurinic or apyrimidinic site) lyase [Thermoflexales bacterium]|nr:bifunctional DNA-formamidopyrimidine glycosylase/DNA-(apurinic or apyrimidinic site) lyase [Thermoflexales bacterium]
MPELPEVETLARELRDILIGRSIVRVGVCWPRTIAAPDPETFARRLAGRRIQEIRRRGKWLLLGLDGGEWLLVHLRMSGRLAVEGADAPEDIHTRVVFHLDDGRRLRFSDPRKFGRMVLTACPEDWLGDLGPEPLAPDLTPERLVEMLRGRRVRLKVQLTDQHFLAGLGNIYADEVLWRAGLSPLRRADTLTPEEAARLLGAIREVLEEAIARQGTTLADRRYVLPDGRPGEFAAHLAVYGREGAPCPRCGASIVRARIGGRSAHFCPQCQQ